MSDARRSRILRRLGLVVLACFFVAAFTPAANLAHRALSVGPRVGPAEAIVVLGAGVSSTGTLSDSSLRRAIRGLELERQGLASVLLLLGPSPRPLGEAEMRGALARSLGVPSEHLRLVTGGQTTREEARRTREELGPDVKRILLVTGSIHMTRSRILFERAGFEVLPAPVDDTSGGGRSPEARLALSLRLGEEMLARVYYRVAGYI